MATQRLLGDHSPVGQQQSSSGTLIGRRIYAEDTENDGGGDAVDSRVGVDTAAAVSIWFWFWFRRGILCLCTKSDDATLIARPLSDSRTRHLVGGWRC